MKQCPRCGKVDHYTTVTQPFCESCSLLLFTTAPVKILGKRGHGGDWIFEYTQSLIHSNDDSSIRVVTTVKPYYPDKTDTRR